MTQSHVGQQLITKFQSSYPPEVSIHAYLERIKKYAGCSDSCFVVALIYIDRMIEIRNVVLTSLNVHRLIITRYIHLFSSFFNLLSEYVFLIMLDANRDVKIVRSISLIAPYIKFHFTV